MYHPLIKLSCSILGFVFLYAALFVYKDDQQIIQNKFIDIWKKIKEKQIEFSRFKAYILVVSEKILDILNRLFGTKNISFRLIGAVGTVSILSFFSISPILFINNEFRTLSNLNGVSFFLLFVFIIALWFNRRNSFPFITYGVLIVTVLSFEFYYGTVPILFSILLFLVISLIFNIALLKLMIYGFRKVITAIVNGRERLKSLVFFLLGLIILCLSWLLFYSLLIDQIEVSSIKGGDLPFFGGLLKVLYFLAIFVYILFLPIVMIVIYAALLIIIFLNLIFWTISKGLFRFLFEHEIIKKRKLLAAVGLFLIGIAFPTLANLERIGKLLEKIF